MSKLAALLEREADAIVEAWRRQVSASMASDALREPELADTLPVFIAEIATTLRRCAGAPGGFGDLPASETAPEHGSERFHLGMDVGAVVREYGFFHEAVHERLEAAGEPVEPWELRMLSQCIIKAISQAVTQFGVERDQALRQKTAQHLAFIAHEIRNPLGSARLAFSVLEQKGLLPAVKSIDVLRRSLGRLERLVDESLTELKLVARPVAQRASVSLVGFLQEVLSESQGDAEQKRVALELDASSDLSLSADRRLLHSALSNLIRNAVKFTREGGRVIVRQRGDATTVTVQVQDECGGLPAGKTASLFDPFVQVGGDRSGFGLGLAIAKQAVEAHGGELSVLDRPGEGCTFSLVIPHREPTV